jgi:2-polyprenyl-3-methyl-5-hydroxy-6-metoxy-1,4-benzoquinol methylase
MSDDALRRELATRYHDIHARYASSSVYNDLTSAWPYYQVNYGDKVSELLRDTRVLEVGPGHGSLLAWFRSLGFKDVRGVDSSAGDVGFANEHLGADTVTNDDATHYLQAHESTFGLIAMKAVLEHIPRSSALGLVQAARRALAPDGLLLVDVPNMDWLLASHERYMDLTHESGFTRESLRTLLLLAFESVDLRGSRPAVLTRSQRLFRRPLIAVTRLFLYVLGEGGNDTLFESRSLVAVARPSPAQR